MIKKAQKKLPGIFLTMRPGQIIALGFAVIIVAGALLLMLPVASKNGIITPFFDALFTSTSATCVTGLTVVETGAHWSAFGQIIILMLIQVGGLGFMTAAVLFSMAVRRKISLRERLVLIESAGGSKLQGIVSITKRTVAVTLIAEFTGTVLLSLRFVPQYGFKGLYYAVFTSVSAFCNAGFDVFGTTRSLEIYQADAFVCTVLMCLIIVGGLGFFVLRNISHIKKERITVHTKLVLITTAILIIGGTASFLIFENNGVLKGLTDTNKLLAAMFQSVTARTAGFSTIDQAGLCDASKFVTSALMFIGGSPGSTAGGIKTVTFAVTVLATVSFIKNSKNTNIFYKTITEKIIMQAFSVFMISLLLAVFATVFFAVADCMSLADSLFMATSALGTAGISVCNISEEMSQLSQIILVFLMFAGRIGSLSLMMAVSTGNGKKSAVEFPDANIFVG